MGIIRQKLWILSLSIFSLGSIALHIPPSPERSSDAALIEQHTVSQPVNAAKASGEVVFKFFCALCLSCALMIFNLHRVKGHETQKTNGIATPKEVECTFLEASLNLPHTDKDGQYPWYSWAWAAFRAVAFMLFTYTCFAFGDRDQMKNSLIAFPLGLAGSMFSCAGVPISGGVVFVPMLVHYANFPPSQAVALSQGVQVVGAAMLVPVTWLQREGPRVIHWKIVPLCLAVGLIGAATAIWIVQLSERNVLLVFTIFNIGLAFFSIHGAEEGNMLVQDDEVELISIKDYSVYSAISWIGGFITAQVGICIDKIVFWTMTGYSKGSPLRSTITGVSINGWVSIFVFCCMAFRGDLIPSTIILMMLPGVVLGTFIGPMAFRAFGSKPILWLFGILLIFECAKNLGSLWDCESSYSLWHAPVWLPGAPCEVS
eukprot:gnl/MRDRNA2_/MRDRNA2_68005_c0_seq1.p1 gnl/MRDRNA2_/MRDRNA2_68005_c0~~gnl/MRDRNA2_/MRDRNA2_68005_c0_seq1.p1  ORF type:complete len:429 (+),score=54.42 gnl/MRDRNA2_/MRDRNA2_68005_c0_seq1:120-1406(+)